jgi:hypothetical protein
MIPYFRKDFNGRKVEFSVDAAGVLIYNNTVKEAAKHGKRLSLGTVLGAGND